MKTIPLSRGKCAIVDDEDYIELIKHKWYAKNIGSIWYAVRHKTISQNNQKTIYMHREIMGLYCYNKHTIDHINHNGLDNRKCNLRLCTQQQNIFNSKGQTISTSKYKGVCWDKRSERWRVCIYVCNKDVALGYFKDEVLAAKAYDKAAKKYYKEFAFTNF